MGLLAASQINSHLSYLLRGVAISWWDSSHAILFPFSNDGITSLA